MYGNPNLQKGCVPIVYFKHNYELRFLETYSLYLSWYSSQHSTKEKIQMVTIKSGKGLCNKLDNPFCSCSSELFSSLIPNYACNIFKEINPQWLSMEIKNINIPSARGQRKVFYTTLECILDKLEWFLLNEIPCKVARLNIQSQK